MHYLHKILIHIPRELIEAGFTREELKAYASGSASSALGDYEERAYQQGYGFSAGRWEDIYPENTYLASDDLEWFLKELEEIKVFQKNHIDRYLMNLTEHLGTDLTLIAEKLWNKSGDHCRENGIDMDLCAYYFSTLAQLLNGDYLCVSHFYNEKRGTARLYPSDIELIKQNPEEWALFMLDYYE